MKPQREEKLPPKTNWASVWTSLGIAGFVLFVILFFHGLFSILGTAA